MSAPHPVRARWLSALVALLALVAALGYPSSYPAGESDDKAVHAFAAAWSFAPAARRAEVRQAAPGWQAQLPSAAERTRLGVRLGQTWNYPLANALIAGIAHELPDVADHLDTRPLRAALWILHLAALALLLFAAGSTRHRLVWLSAILLVSLWAAAWEYVVPSLRKDMLPLIYAPRGSAVLVILASAAAWAQGRSARAALLAGLAVTWHVGLGLLALFLLALAEGVRRACARPQGGRALALYGLVAVGLSALLSWGTLTTHLAHWPALALISEVPLRLSGLIATLAVALLLFAALAPARGGTEPSSLRLLAVTVVVLVAIGWGTVRAQWWTAGRQTPFWCGDHRVALVAVADPAHLARLPPRREDVFFATLARYLRRGAAGPRTSGPP